MEIKMSADFAAQIEAAKERLKTKPIDLDQIRREENEAYFKADMKRAAHNQLGERFAQCTFDNFKRNDNNKLAYGAARRLAGGFKRDKKGLILAGPNGIGKNHLTAAMVNELADQIKSAFYSNITKVKTKICDAFGYSVEEAIESILSKDLICINDLGAERDNDYAKELLFDLVDRLYEDKRCLVITTNLTDEEMFKRYGSRIVSRFFEMCDMVRYADYDHRVN